jgi:hypothetical protein
MRVDIYIGSDKVDLFADEAIELVSSVADIEDITKNTTDYTKTFTVPSSRSNDILFKHWYNANVNNSFDARVKIDGRIELDGMLFRLGKFRLTKVAVKKGLPSSYTINFWGNLISLKDVLGKDELSDLDLSAYDHDYDSSTVENGLVNSLSGGDLIYNLFAKKQYYYNSDVSDTAENNIAWSSGGSNGVIWNDLTPSLRLIKIIEAIEAKAEYNITFSRDFFGRTEFNDLFMWLNNSKDIGIGGDSQLVDFDGGDDTYMNLSTNIGAYPVQTRWTLECTVIPVAGYESVDYTLITFRDDTEFASNDFTDTSTATSRFITADSLYYHIKSDVEFKYTVSLKQKILLGASVTTTATENTKESTFVTSENIPKIKIIDFLKGLFKMFKLVVVSQNDGSLYVNTFNDYYAAGQVYDVTKYIDNDNYDVSRGKILNEINYLYSEPQTILNKVFEENTRVAYGDAEIQLADENGTPLDGDTLEFTLPFEQILYERLTDQNDTELTNIQYGAIIDDNLSPVNPKPVIFYNIYQSIGSKSIGFIDELGVKSSLSVNINTPSHTIGFESSNFSTVFDREFSTWGGERINNTLYTNYHEAYILSIFDVRKRSFNYKAKNLPLRIMLDLELNDLLKIRDTFYRIDKFTSNLLTGEVSLNLVNSFTDTINSFEATPSSFFIDYTEQQVSSYITNLGNFISNKVDLGSGVDWVTVSNVGNNVYFDVDLSELETGRDITIEFTNTDTLQETEVYISQGANPIISFNHSMAKNSQYIPIL